jgi:hypothetical protein
MFVIKYSKSWIADPNRQLNDEASRFLNIDIEVLSEYEKTEARFEEAEVSLEQTRGGEAGR